MAVEGWAKFAPFDYSGTAALNFLFAVVILTVINDLVDPLMATGAGCIQTR